MKATPFRLFVLLITSAISVIVCYIAGLIIHMNVFGGTARGFELLVMGIALAIVYTVARFYSRMVIVVVSVLVGAVVAWLMMRVQGNAVQLYLIYIGLLVLTGLILELFWMRPNGLRLKNIPFAVMGAVAYSLMVLIGSTINGETPTTKLLIGYLEFGLFLYLGFSLAMIVSERIYFPLGIKWNVEGFYIVDEEGDGDSNE